MEAFYKVLINDEEYELLYTIKLGRETNKKIISLLHSTGTSDTSLACITKSSYTSKLQTDAKLNSDFNSRGSKIRLRHKGSTRLVIIRCCRISTPKPLKDHQKIDFKRDEEPRSQNQSQELDIIDVLFGNDILKDSIINQKDKIIKLNNSTYKINYQQSNQLHCNVKAPRKNVTVSNNNQSESHNLLDDEEDIKEQVTKDGSQIIDLGIIKRSESNYSSSIMLLKKIDVWRVVHKSKASVVAFSFSFLEFSIVSSAHCSNTL
ncbi:hypothetical protein ACTFIW_001001 [Dictyostelium discoideum]